MMSDLAYSWVHPRFLKLDSSLPILYSLELPWWSFARTKLWFLPHEILIAFRFNSEKHSTFLGEAVYSIASGKPALHCMLLPQAQSYPSWSIAIAWLS
jgi:hypothetical protein